MKREGEGCVSREIFLYPWDVLDEGVESIVQRLQALRIRHASIAALYHQARMLLPHNPVRKLAVHAGGTCYIPFDRERYGALAPRSPLTDYDGLLETLAQRLRAAGIGMSAWMVLMHNSWLASAHPQLAITGVFGDRSPSNLCPSHPEVQDYVCALCADLKRAGVDQMDAESLDFAGFLHGDHHEMQAYADIAQLDRWLGLCFCQACQMRARAKGIDVERLMAQVRRAAEDVLQMRPVRLPEAELLAAYDDMRCGVIAELFQRMKQESGLRIRPILWLAGGADPLRSGVDVARMHPDEVIACYPDAPERTDDFVVRTRAMTPEATRITGGIRLMNPQTVSARQGPEYERRYDACGVDEVIFYNYGMAPDPMLAALEDSAEEEA